MKEVEYQRRLAIVEHYRSLPMGERTAYAESVGETRKRVQYWSRRFEQLEIEAKSDAMEMAEEVVSSYYLEEIGSPGLKAIMLDWRIKDTGEKFRVIEPAVFDGGQIEDRCAWRLATKTSKKLKEYGIEASKSVLVTRIMAAWK